MFRHMINWLSSTRWQGKRAAVPTRKRATHTRVESLESRSMLSFTLIYSGDFRATGVVNDQALFSSASSLGQPSLSLPQFNGTPRDFDGGMIPIPTEPWKFEVKPVAPAASAQLDPLPVDPLAVDPAVKPLDPSPMIPTPINPAPANPKSNNPAPTIPDTAAGGAESDSGFDSWDQDTGLENPGDVKPLDDPSPRELNSVLQMLAGLKYPVSGGETVTDIASNFAAFVPNDQRLEVMQSEPDGGTVAIAVSEIADELAAARALPSELEESLLEITVQMDRSAGRLQAFEVLTLEAPIQPARDLHSTEALPPADAGAVRFETGEEENGAELPKQTSSRAADREAQAAPAAAVDGSLALAADEKTGSTWSLTIALVTFGFVLQLMRDRHGERLRAKAIAVWQKLQTIAFWKSVDRRI